MDNKIPSDVIALSNAHGVHTQALGKYWGLAVTVAILAFTAEATTEVIEIFGFKLKADFFYPACAIFGAILNFAYCISHLQAYRTAEIFQKFLASIEADSKEFSGEFTLSDVAYTLSPSAINRVYPVFHFLPKTISKRMVQFLKIPVDMFVFLSPIAGCAYALTKIQVAWWSVPIWTLVCISGLMSVVLTYSGFRWVLAVTNDATNPGKNSDSQDGS